MKPKISRRKEIIKTREEINNIEIRLKKKRKKERKKKDQKESLKPRTSFWKRLKKEKENL